MDWWHLPTLDPPKGPQRRLVTACGENFGESELDWDRDETVIGNRCPACQGEALRRASRRSRALQAGTDSGRHDVGEFDEATRLNDAVVGTTAACDVDLLVIDDIRFKKRMARVVGGFRVLTFDEFVELLGGLLASGRAS